MKRVAILALSLLALLAVTIPASARADWKATRALQISQIVWHPACGQLRLAYGDPTLIGVPDEAGGWARAGDCEIGIDSRKTFSFEMLCQIVLHEGGHVDGLGHSENQSSVMRASFIGIKTVARISGKTYTRWDGIDSRCLDRGRPFLEQHGAL